MKTLKKLLAGLKRLGWREVPSISTEKLRAFRNWLRTGPYGTTTLWVDDHGKLTFGDDPVTALPVNWFNWPRIMLAAA